jgi:hypothetical protein
MRVYLPATVTTLRSLLDQGQVAGEPLPAYAVTPALREWYVEGDEEELEYAAMSLAARASLRLLDADLDAPRRRVVIVAEVGDGHVAAVPHVDRAAVRVAVAVPLTAVQAVHVDGREAEDDVRAAVDAVVEADLGSQDAAFRMEQAEGHELLWYASQEIGALLELG